MRRGAIAPRAGALLVAGTLAAIALATLLPMGRHISAFNWCFACAPRASADAVMNIALFVPLGLGLRLLGVSVLRAFLAGFLMTVGVEVAQTIVPGRDPAFSDLVWNGGGTLLGAVIAGWAWMMHPSPAVAPRLALAASTAGVALTFTAGFLIAPSFPSRVYWSQWTPELASMPAYPGSLLSARIGGHDVPAGPVPAAVGMPSLLATGAPIDLALRAGTPPQMESTIFSLAESERLRPLIIGARGADLFLRYRTRAVDYRFSQPDLWAAGLLADVAPGNAFTLTVSREGERICMQAGNKRRCDLGYAPGDAWMLLVSSGLLPHPLRPAAPVGWLALLALPVGFWWRPGIAGALAASMLPAGVLLLAPAMTALGPAVPRDWIAVAGGGLLGLAAARLAGSTRAWPATEPASSAHAASPVPRSTAS